MEKSVTKSDHTLVKSLLKTREAGSHKGTHGHALLLTGSKGKMGAAVIAARACLRTGAGLLTVNVPAEERNILQVTIPEAMLAMRGEEVEWSRFSSAGIGPAIGLDDEACRLVETFLTNYQKPVLLDADALTILSLNKTLWPAIPAGSVLTPHPKEFDRMFGAHQDIEERNLRAIAISLLYPWVIVLKGQHTQIAWQGRAYSNSTGNPGLAKGGSGDALSGIILSLLAQGYVPVNAAIIGVYLHGLAADMALKTQSPESMLPTDVIECIGNAFEITR